MNNLKRDIDSKVSQFFLGFLRRTERGGGSWIEGSIFSVLAILMSTYYASRRIAFYDFNFIQNTVYRMQIGQFPYRDFDLVLPAFTFFIVLLFAVSVSSSISFSIYLSTCLIIVISIFSVVGILNSLKDRFKFLGYRRFRLPFLTFCCVFNIVSVYPNYIYDSVVAAFSLVALHFFLKFLKNSRNLDLMACSVALAATVFSKYNSGVPLMFGFLTTIVLKIYVSEAKNVKEFIKFGGVLIAPTLALGLTCICIFGNQFIYQTLLAPGDYKGVFRLYQLAQYENLILEILFIFGLLGIVKPDFRRLFFRLVVLAVVILLVGLTFSRLFLSTTLEMSVMGFFGGVDLLFPIMILFAFFRVFYDFRKLEMIEAVVLISIPMLFLGSFLSQGWWGSSYALYPHLFIMLIFLHHSKEPTNPTIRARLFIFTVTSLIAVQLIWNIGSGIRLGYVENAGLRQGSPNWEKLGTAYSSRDVNSLKEVQSAIASTGVKGTLLAFPPEDLLQDFSDDLTPWGRCLQFIDICPTTDSEQILMNFQSKAPTFLVLKLKPQINVRPVVPESIALLCFSKIFENDVYQVFTQNSASQVCIKNEFTSKGLSS